MKKTLLCLLFSLTALCTFAAVNSVTIKNNSSCNIYVKAYADTVLSCGLTYEGDWIGLAPGTSQSFFPSTMLWLTPPTAIGYGIWWTGFIVSNKPGCPIGTGGAGCPAGDQITLSSCPPATPVSGCFTITNNCNICPIGTKVGVNISVVGSVTYVVIN